MDPLERPEAQIFRCYQAVAQSQMVAERLVGNLHVPMVMLGRIFLACSEAILGHLSHAPNIPIQPVDQA